MATEVILPKFGFTLEESQIVEWLKQEGDEVETGDPIVEVTTDKVNMEVEATGNGILAGLQANEGDIVPVTAVIAYILAPGESLPETAPKPPSTAAAPKSSVIDVAPKSSSADVAITPVAARFAEAEGVDVSQVQGSGPGGRITRNDVESQQKKAAFPVGKVQATPAARRIAAEMGAALEMVTGSGPNGRIQGDDVRRAVSQPKPAPTPAPVPSAEEGVTRIPFTQMRRTIAQNMQRSMQEAPHITFQADMDMTAVLQLPKRANDLLYGGERVVSVTAVLTKAVAWTLKQHPALNSHLGDDEVIQFRDVHIGMAVALPDGLIVPVIKHTDQKGIGQLAADIRDAARRARENKLRGGDLSGGTFTISNLGMFGVDRFTAIINPPEVGILAVGSTSRRFVPDANDQPVLRSICTMTLSVDHRVIDGAVAAQFLTTLRRAVENPELISL